MGFSREGTLFRYRDTGRILYQLSSIVHLGILLYFRRGYFSNYWKMCVIGRLGLMNERKSFLQRRVIATCLR